MAPKARSNARKKKRSELEQQHEEQDEPSLSLLTQPKKRQKRKTFVDEEPTTPPINPEANKEISPKMTGRIRRQKADITDTATEPGKCTQPIREGFLY